MYRTGTVPPNITPVPLPRKSPELNQIENVSHACAPTGYQIEFSQLMNILSNMARTHGTKPLHSNGALYRQAPREGESVSDPDRQQEVYE